MPAGQAHPGSNRDRITRACIVCGSEVMSQVPGPRSQWSYVKCGVCAHTSLSPMPTAEELQSYYNGAYTFPADAHIGDAAKYAAVVSRALGEVRAGKMLEIGCSYGAVLSHFRDRGWVVEGVELDERAASRARLEFGIDVHSGTLQDSIGRLHPPYDVIGFYHVIEHVLDPRQFLLDVRSLLSANGVVVIRTPNIVSTVALCAKGWWEWCVAPEHVHIFSPGSLVRLLSDAGFTLDRRITHRGAAHATLVELARLLVNRVARARARNGDRREPPPTASGTQPGESFPLTRRALSLLSAPFDRALDAAGVLGSGVGPEIVITATRTSAQLVDEP